MRLIAIEEFDYNGKRYKPGDEFESLNQLHGQVLVQQRRADEKSKKHLETRAMQAKEPEPDKPHNRKGRYMRRDMRPED